MSIQVAGIAGIPLIKTGDSIAEILCEKTAFEDGDIVCIASTIVSKANGYLRALKDIEPSEDAVRISGLTKEDPRFIQGILDSSKDIIIEYPVILAEVPC